VDLSSSAVKSPHSADAARSDAKASIVRALSL